MGRGLLAHDSDRATRPVSPPNSLKFLLSDLKMKVVCSSETLLYSRKNTGRKKPEDINCTQIAVKTNSYKFTSQVLTTRFDLKESTLQIACKVEMVALLLF
jgi:hypothetical protein